MGIRETLRRRNANQLPPPARDPGSLPSLWRSPVRANHPPHRPHRPHCRHSHRTAEQNRISDGNRIRPSGNPTMKKHYLPLLTALPLILFAATPGVRAPLQPVAHRKPAPEIALTGSDGKPMKLADYRGKVVLL